MTTKIIEAESGRLLEAVLLVLARRGLVTAQEVDERIEITDRASPAIGAAMVARAWCEPDFRTRMIENGTEAAEAMGVAMRGLPPLGVLENTATVHHLVVCTLCSCYPRAVLGYPPYWFKSAAFRARAVRNPRDVLAEWGTVLAADTSIHVVDSTADYRWMVLPCRPARTEGWSQDALAALVGEGDMIGVTVPSVGDRRPRVGFRPIAQEA